MNNIEKYITVLKYFYNLYIYLQNVVIICKLILPVKIFTYKRNFGNSDYSRLMYPVRVRFNIFYIYSKISVIFFSSHPPSLLLAGGDVLSCWWFLKVVARIFLESVILHGVGLLKYFYKSYFGLSKQKTCCAICSLLCDEVFKAWTILKNTLQF